MGPHEGPGKSSPHAVGGETGVGGGAAGGGGEGGGGGGGGGGTAGVGGGDHGSTRRTHVTPHGRIGENGPWHVHVAEDGPPHRHHGAHTPQTRTGYFAGDPKPIVCVCVWVWWRGCSFSSSGLGWWSGVGDAGFRVGSAARASSSSSSSSSGRTMSGGETGRAVVVVVFVVVVAVFVVVVAEVCASAEAKGRGTTAAGPCRARLASPTRASPPSSSSAAGSSVDCAAASGVVAVVAVAVVALAGPAAALGPTDELPLRPWSRLLAPSATDDRGAASQRGCALTDWTRARVSSAARIASRARGGARRVITPRHSCAVTTCHSFWRASDEFLAPTVRATSHF